MMIIVVAVMSLLSIRREQQSFQMDLSVIALTSYAMRGDGERSCKAGCVAYLTKPIDTRRFLDLIGQHLPHDGPAEHPA